MFVGRYLRRAAIYGGPLFTEGRYLQRVAIYGGPLFTEGRYLRRAVSDQNMAVDQSAEQNVGGHCMGADSSNVCMEDQLKAYRLKHQTVSRIKQCPNPTQPKKVKTFKEQSKPYCGRVNKTRFQTEYNQEFFREGNAYRHTNDWLHHLNLVRRLTQ